MVNRCKLCVFYLIIYSNCLLWKIVRYIKVNIFSVTFSSVTCSEILTLYTFLLLEGCELLSVESAWRIDFEYRKTSKKKISRTKFCLAFLYRTLVSPTLSPFRQICALLCWGICSQRVRSCCDAWNEIFKELKDACQLNMLAKCGGLFSGTESWRNVFSGEVALVDSFCTLQHMFWSIENSLAHTLLALKNCSPYKIDLLLLPSLHLIRRCLLILFLLWCKLFDRNKNIHCCIYTGVQIIYIIEKKILCLRNWTINLVK